MQWTWNWCKWTFQLVTIGWFIGFGNSSHMREPDITFSTRRDSHPPNLQFPSVKPQEKHSHPVKGKSYKLLWPWTFARSLLVRYPLLGLLRMKSICVLVNGKGAHRVGSVLKRLGIIHAWCTNTYFIFLWIVLLEMIDQLIIFVGLLDLTINESCIWSFLVGKQWCWVRSPEMRPIPHWQNAEEFWAHFCKLLNAINSILSILVEVTRVIHYLLWWHKSTIYKIMICDYSVWWESC